MITRRAHLTSLLGAAASAALPRALRAAVGDDIPPEGIGRVFGTCRTAIRAAGPTACR